MFILVITSLLEEKDKGAHSPSELMDAFVPMRTEKASALNAKASLPHQVFTLIKRL